MTRLIMLAAALALFVVALDAHAAERSLEQFWIKYDSDFQKPEAYDAAMKFLDEARAAGVTHMVLNEQSMHRWDLVDDAYLAKITAFRKAADERGITISPNIFPIGYGIRYLVHDVNLAAGLPVKAAPFVVRGGLARPDLSAVPAIANPGFEEADGNALSGWTQDLPGEGTFVDAAEKHSGGASLRIQGARGRGGARVTQTLAVEPFKYYRLSAWFKTQDAGKQGEDLFLIRSHDDKCQNAYLVVPIESTQDWTRHDIVFNTLDTDTVTLSIGAGRMSGAMWVDDVSIEPAGILNVVRRPLLPVVVTSADGAAVYEEGRDFERVLDPAFVYDKLADIDHEAAPIRLTPASRIKDGDRILVSYYHTQRIYLDQVVLSLSDPELYEFMEKQMAHIARVWPSAMYFMSADEIRIAGWEPQPGGEHLTPSELLARYMQRSYDLVKRYVPDAGICVWSDMFTPFHNARPFEERGYYYITTGTFYGSWKGLPKDALIANWYSPNRLNPIWFESLGHKQILCGYYDNPNLKPGIARWMQVTEGVDGVIGIMYTNWSTGYDHMAEYFRLAREYPAWVEEGQGKKAEVRER